MPCCRDLWRTLTRKKPLTPPDPDRPQLARVLNLLDLTFLGVGSTLGAAMYVLVGQVARNIAGPAVVMSFTVAAVAAFMAGICYAEFGARVPNTGSAYVYGYIIVGELAAFIIGWNLILEYVIGTACAARAWSANFDSLTNDAIQRFMAANVPLGVPFLAEYPDFFAVVITLLLTVILMVGVKLSSQFNNVFTIINLLVITYVVICGLFKVDFSNWSIPKNEIHRTGAGVGGFFPFGIDGMLSGAASCFFAFVGFDCIATTGEEAIRPERNIPLGILLALLVVFLSYVGVSSVLTLMVPYYLIDSEAPIPTAFDYVGWGVARYIIAVGAVCGLSTSLMGSMFPMPRVIYAMSGDGVIFRCLSAVSERFQTPARATVLSGVFCGLMALFFDQQQLVDMLSIGTLLAYTLVAISVLFVRYREKTFNEPQDAGKPLPGLTDVVYPAQTAIPLYTTGLLDRTSPTKTSTPTKGDKQLLNDTSDGNVKGQKQYLVNASDCTINAEKQYLMNTSDGTAKGQPLIRRLFAPMATTPTSATEEIAVFCIGIACLLIIFFDTALVCFETHLVEGQAWAVVLVCGLAAAIVLLSVIISRQPQTQEEIKFKVPFLPLLPLLSTFVNVYLMLKLSTATWIRFGVWMTVGFGVYFLYGIKHSNLSENPDTSTYQNLDLVCPDLDLDSPKKKTIRNDS